MKTHCVLFWLRLVALTLGLAIGTAFAKERIPPAPKAYFNDYAAVVSPAVSSELNAQLEANERTTSNQLLVAIYPRMESDSSVQDYTVRIAESWRVGQAGKDNGAGLFVFLEQREIFLQVGYGLEPVLTDATAKQIVENELIPYFRQNKIDEGMRASVVAMIAATKGEYKGTGRIHAENGGAGGKNVNWLFIFIGAGVFLIPTIIAFMREIRRPGSGDVIIGGPRVGPRRSSPWISSGGSSGGRFGGGGGFSGGGGRFGGGGAGGRW